MQTLLNLKIKQNDKNLAEKIIKDYIHNYKKADSHDQI